MDRSEGTAATEVKRVLAICLSQLVTRDGIGLLRSGFSFCLYYYVLYNLLQATSFVHFSVSLCLSYDGKLFRAFRAFRCHWNTKMQQHQNSVETLFLLHLQAVIPHHNSVDKVWIMWHILHTSFWAGCLRAPVYVFSEMLIYKYFMALDKGACTDSHRCKSHKQDWDLSAHFANRSLWEAQKVLLAFSNFFLNEESFCRAASAPAPGRSRQ